MFTTSVGLAIGFSCLTLPTYARSQTALEESSSQATQVAQNTRGSRAQAPAQTPRAQAAPRESRRQPRPRAQQRQNRQRRANPSQPALRVVDGPVVKSIVVEGNKKIEVDAIIAKLATKEGEGFTAAKVREDLGLLFKTGFFYDVKVDREAVEGGVRLTYSVVEKPAITSIVFSGNSELDSDELSTAAGIKAYEVLNMARIRSAVEKVQKLYEDKGYFL
ncbi:MAG: POTRA domain-containing protein, partial [Bdellovibrionales bacterium]|nr:POTRA domain-containing protein [Bdellovibrionales bacterium]